MDSLVPAFIAVLIASATDRNAWLAAILGERYRAPARLWAGIVLAQIALAAIAVGGAAMVRPMMNERSGALLLALAMLAAGMGMMFRTRQPDRLERWRLGAAINSFVGTFLLGFGERAQFLLFALAVQGPYPWLAGVGGALGSAVAIIPALMLGEAGWRALPLRAISVAGGVAFLLIGAFEMLSAIEII
ncbi:TMEM165/GDT1 family protein [Stakelama sp. CBK3Z-3]|uniref:GDT1 family protein n=1 Tax=Stakelama flava TaxID=2860338 RepID=A0ABS6XK78_9SPHN|nr:TMEM165/GDT1 family protein [Stakelama flava]MBW4330607.1 TMEM165/GDT1 family protein [Stakelama flava]